MEHMSVNIPGKLLARMQSLFNSNKKLLQVILYGPRTREDYPDDASIRLAVLGPMGSRDIRQLRHQLGNMPTSLEFDVIHLDHLTDEEQKQVIFEEGIEIFCAKNVRKKPQD